MDQTEPTVVAAEPAPSAEVPSKKGLFSFLSTTLILASQARIL